jgi:valyl-tRNA synthetase
MKELSKSYDPKLVEDKLYAFWKEHRFFQADPHSKKPPFTIVIPPPNVTGVLHMGHALVDTLQDVLIRWKRMSGFEALWIPGTDHAGIATQTVVERHLVATLGKKRKDFSREEFLKHVWEWKNKSEQEILKQLEKLGCSCDWSRLAFTMDAPRNRAVFTMFQKMYKAGLIYRGDYLVNWDPVYQTALADDEVEYEEKEGSLWHIQYGEVAVATTRPETLLGDTALAVAPQDSRYQHLVGKTVQHPLLQRTIPIVADSHVDPTFGTGVVKVTPAHDPNDHEIGRRHNLPLINIMTPDGKINENGGKFAGLTMAEARIAVVEELKKRGLLLKTEKHPHRVGVSYRSKAVIEPYLSKQWFVRLTHFKQILIDLVKTKKVALIPDHFEATYFHWIHNLRDWCISRQLWWGHRIPIWYRGEETVCSETSPGPDWKQDGDVLDTWFSSALWPFSVLGWPDTTDDLKKFYPTSTLVTGHDILFFWVARMMMMGEYALQEPPFKEVFLHGLIYGKSYWRYDAAGAATYLKADERTQYDMGKAVPAEVHSKWEKMSKSKGNIIDPLEIIDAFGTDAMRMALCASATQARQIDLDRRRFEEFKNFANKIWNGARFVLMNLSDLQLDSGLALEALTLEDRWILSLLNRTIGEVNAHLKVYAFDKAALLSYDFFWKEFCAYYVELCKPYLFGKVGTPLEKTNKQKILLVVLCNALRLLHPMAPFITEELFQTLKESFGHAQADDLYMKETLQALKAPACIVAPYPNILHALDISPDIEDEFAFLDKIVHAIRTIRAEMQIPPGTATDLYLIGPTPELLPVEKNQTILKGLVRLEKIHLLPKEQPLPFSSTALLGSLKIVIPLPAEMKEKEKSRLLKEQEKLIQQQNGARTQLANPDFVAKAPPALVEKLQRSLEQTSTELSSLAQKLKDL